MIKQFIKVLFFCLISLSAYANTEMVFVVNGVSGNEKKNVEARLNGTKLAYFDDNNDLDVNKIYNLGKKEVQKALQPYGYYQAEVVSHLTHYHDTWTAEYDIRRGKALRITALDIRIEGEGAHNPEILKVYHELPLKRGKILLTEEYETSKQRLLDVANSQGFIKARFTKVEIKIDLASHRSSVTIHMNTGGRYYFGETTFDASPYASSFLYRFLNYHEGEPFSNEKLIQLQQDMGGSYYFNGVNINPLIDHPHGNTIPVHINTIPTKSERYSLGLGYGTFTGPRLTSGVSFRRITDTGHHFDMNLRVSSVLSMVSAKYYIPGKNPITDRWVMGGSYQNFDPKHGQSESQSYLFGHIRKIHNFQTSLSLNYLLERYNVQNDPSRKRNLLYPNLTIGYVKANDLINPTHGYSANLSLQGASQYLFSATSFAQVDLKGKYLISLFSFAKIIARAEVGYTVVHDLYTLPLTIRFFAGGLNSIRGFEDSSIGPGRYLQTGSLEYQNKLYGNIYGALFYDIGAASNKFGTPINKGAGVGVVYYSLVGPVKVYLAKAISKKDQPYSVEFSVGPEF